MITSPRFPTATLALGFLLLTGTGRVHAQDAGKTSDDALDSLLEKLADPKAEKPAASKSDKPKEKAASDVAKKKKPDPTPKPKQAPTPKPDAAKPKPAAPDELPTKDQELDDLLEKLGETKDAPTPEDPHKGGGPGEEGKEPSKSSTPDGSKSPASKLGKGDKELDERLEELTGRKRKKPGDNEQRPAAVNDIIKEMRDVEQRLGKPDTGDDTRTRQKQIVKRIETLIEEVRKSRSSMRSMTMRRVRQQGRQPGDQQPGGEQQGAMAGGVGLQKPAKPTTQHSTANGKDIWGHLPPELRSEIENTFKEAALSSKQELVDRYYLSVGKGKLVREE
jgi:hypothetical protein